MALTPFTLSIDEDGTIRGLMDGATGEFFHALDISVDGTVKVARASHVEPSNPLLRPVFRVMRWMFGEYGRMANFTRMWPCMWRVNLRPVHGPILPQTYRDRSKAIEAEVTWLHRNFL